MIIPSFTGFAPTPNTSQAYLGGIAASQRDRQLSLEEQQMAQQAMQANQALQQKQQALAQEAEESAMRSKIAQEQIQSRMFIDQQQVNIRQQYETQKNALEAQKVQTAQKTLQLKTADAAQKFQAQENYGLTRQSLIDSGMSEADASAQAARQWFPQMGASGNALNSVMKQNAGFPGGVEAKAVPGLPGMVSAPSGPNSVRYFKTNQPAMDERSLKIREDQAANKLATDEARVAQGERRLDISEKVAASKETQAKIKSLTEVQDKDWQGSLNAIKVAKGGKVTAEERASAKEYATRQETLNKLVGGGGKKSAPNEVLKYKDGKPYGYYDKETGEPIRLYAE